MTIDKAIKILTNFDNGKYPGGAVEFREAVKLGIEALKWRKLMESDYGSWCGPPLPGEIESDQG